MVSKNPKPCNFDNQRENQFNRVATVFQKNLGFIVTFVKCFMGRVASASKNGEEQILTVILVESLFVKNMRN